MLPINGMMGIGYKSLADKVLQAYHQASPVLMPNADARTSFENSLSELKRTGDIASLAAELQSAATYFGALCEQAIPERFKPQKAEDALSMATEAVQHYKGFSSKDEMEAAAALNLMERTDDAPLAVTYYDEYGSRVRMLYWTYNPKWKSESVIGNVHEWLHVFQVERDQRASITSALAGIPGFREFYEFVETQEELKDMKRLAIIQAHELHFFAHQKIKKMAKTHGVDMRQLSTLLVERIPELDFLICYTEGEAYVNTLDAISRLPVLQAHPPSAALYRLETLLKTVQVPFNGAKGIQNAVGIGMYEYLKSNGKIEAAKVSRSLHREIHNTFFKDVALTLPS